MASTRLSAALPATTSDSDQRTGCFCFRSFKSSRNQFRKFDDLEIRDTSELFAVSLPYTIVCEIFRLLMCDETVSYGAAFRTCVKVQLVNRKWRQHMIEVMEKTSHWKQIFSKEEFRLLAVSRSFNVPFAPPKGLIVQCSVRWRRERLQPDLYLCHLQNTVPIEERCNSPFATPIRMLLVARRPFGSRYIHIASSEENLNRGVLLAQLRSNFIGTEYVLLAQSKDDRTFTSEIGCVCYRSNPLGMRGPRVMLVGVLAYPGDVYQQDMPPASNNFVQRVQAPASDENIIRVPNKSPTFNEARRQYCLQFNGRVTVASVKNFQIVSDDELLLQFGKVDDDQFTMDFCAPMSGLLAFAICVSSIEHKLACE